MTRRYIVQDPGDTPFLPGERIDARVLREANERLSKEGKRTAEGRPELMGITKAAISTDSWLSAASFQETTRVLTEAAIDAKSDSLIGLKENIIIGKVIPAGTGMDAYNLFGIDYPGYVRAQSHTTEGDEGIEVDPAAFAAPARSASELDASDVESVLGVSVADGVTYAITGEAAQLAVAKLALLRLCEYQRWDYFLEGGKQTIGLQRARCVGRGYRARRGAHTAHGKHAGQQQGG